MSLLLLFVGGLGAGYWFPETGKKLEGDASLKEEAEDKNKNPTPDTHIQAENFFRYFRRVQISGDGALPESMPEAVFENPDGTLQSWKDFRGRYLLVNIWASWCTPCVVELPSLGDLQKRYAGQGMEVIAISIDRAKNREILGEFLQSRNIGFFALYRDSQGQIRANIPLQGVPSTFLLGPEGRLLYSFEGDANWMAPESLLFFDTLLTPGLPVER